MAAVAAPSVAMTPDLKRLAFVENAAVTSLSYVTDSSIFAKACGYYSSAKETNALKGSLTKIESLMKVYGAPVVTKVSEKYPGYMTTVDSKVDSAVSLLMDIWTNKVVASTPVSYAKSALALAPTKIEDLKAVYMAREEYFKKIEDMLGTLKDRAVKLPSSLLTALSNAISEARAHLDNAHLFEKVAAAYEAVLKYPAVVSLVEKTAPVAAKAVDMATPYYDKAKALAGPYVTKVGDMAGPYVTKVHTAVEPYVAAIKEKVYPASNGITVTAAAPVKVKKTKAPKPPTSFD